MVIYFLEFYMFDTEPDYPALLKLNMLEMLANLINIKFTFQEVMNFHFARMLFYGYRPTMFGITTCDGNVSEQFACRFSYTRAIRIRYNDSKSLSSLNTYIEFSAVFKAMTNLTFTRRIEKENLFDSLFYNTPIGIKHLPVYLGYLNKFKAELVHKAYDTPYDNITQEMLNNERLINDAFVFLLEKHSI